MILSSGVTTPQIRFNILRDRALYSSALSLFRFKNFSYNDTVNRFLKEATMAILAIIALSCFGLIAYAMWAAGEYVSEAEADMETKN